MSRHLLSQRLERQGCTVTTAVNGRQALELVRSQPFDLVLLDIMMPELNGYQVLEQLKADPALQHLPVIMISALDEIDSVVRCIEMGAEDYLPSPSTRPCCAPASGPPWKGSGCATRSSAPSRRSSKSQKQAGGGAGGGGGIRPLAAAGALAGDIATDWRFQPSTRLGGNSFGYHWIDPRALRPLPARCLRPRHAAPRCSRSPP